LVKGGHGVAFVSHPQWIATKARLEFNGWFRAN
jgi:hypothetical protein